MTTNLFELDAQVAALPPIQVPHAPDPERVSPLPFSAESIPDVDAAPSRAATLLSAQGDTPSGNIARLLIGLGGIALLGLITPSATLLVSRPTIEQPVLEWLLWCGLQMSAFVVVAALALSIALPGLWILLVLFEVHLRPQLVLNAVARAYLRAGLFCLGFVPCLLLYASTGGELGLTTFSGTLCYFAAGVLGLSTLALDLRRMLSTHFTVGNFLVFGWFCLSTVMGIYLFVKMQISIINFGGHW